MSAGPATNDESRRNAFATHVVPEINVLLRVAHTLVARPADAEDLVQDTLLRAFGAIESFDGSHPRAWLITIMRNAQVNRTRRRRPQLLDDPDAAMDHLDNAEEARTGPEAVVVDAAFDAVVAEGLDALPDRLRRVVELVDIDGLRYAEAAEALGVPVGTVMSRLHRARVRLRERLASAGLAPKRGGTVRSWMHRRSGGAEATCAEVARVLQSYLDGQLDEMTARRVARHLEACRRCGLEAHTYEAIKQALARRRTDVDADALERLRSFGERLAHEGPPDEAGSPA